MTAMDDRHVDRLVRRAVKGDVEAFGRLYDAYVDRVYAFVRSRIGDAHDAEDVTESVFLKAFEAIANYDQRGLPFAAWLFRIARNATIDHVRRARRIPEAVEDVEVHVGSDPVLVDEFVARRIEDERVREAVSELTEDQAAVIACRFFWDFNIPTTAESLGRTEGAVKALQHRALRNLGRMFEEMANDG